MNRSRSTVFVYRRTKAPKLRIGEEPLALTSPVHPYRQARVRAFWLDAPLLGLVEHRPQDLTRPVCCTRPSILCYTVEPLLHMGLLDLVEKHPCKRRLKIVLPIQSMRVQRRCLPGWRDLAPVGIEKVRIERHLAARLSLLCRVLTDLGTQKYTPRNIHRLCFAQYLGIANRNGSRPSLHCGLNDVDRASTRVVARPETRQAPRPDYSA